MSHNSPSNTLYYINAILKYSNYGKAAKSLYVSQPYLTQVIKRIERQLNCELINRTELPYRLTEQGKIYYEYLTLSENHHSRFLQEINALNNSKEQVLRIGILASLGTYLLPLLLPKFLESYPNCKIELVEDIPENNEKRALDGDIDFWIGQNSRNISPYLNSYVLGENSYYAIIPRSCHLFQENIEIIEENTIEMKTLLSQNLILTSKGSSIRKQIDQLLSLYKINPTILLESTEIHTISELAVNNIGVTFLPESLIIDTCASQYNIYPISKDELSLDFFIAYHSERKLSEIDQDFISSFKANSKE